MAAFADPGGLRHGERQQRSGFQNSPFRRAAATLSITSRSKLLMAYGVQKNQIVHAITRSGCCRAFRD